MFMTLRRNYVKVLLQEVQTKKISTAIQDNLTICSVREVKKGVQTFVKSLKEK